MDNVIEKCAQAIADEQVLSEDGLRSASLRQLFLQLADLVPGGFDEAQFDRAMDQLARAVLLTLIENMDEGMVEAGAQETGLGFAIAEERDGAAKRTFTAMIKRTLREE